MKVARKFEEITEYNLPRSITDNEYLNKFASKMMSLSNELDDVEEDIDYNDNELYDLKEKYLPAIREFILNITGL